MTLINKERIFKKEISVKAPINIALIKYWGKEDETKILPLNNSISLTLDPYTISSTTYLEVSTSIKDSYMLLNDKEFPVTSRMYRMFEIAILKSGLTKDIQQSLKFFIKSKNNFPTAAGMASSASGMAAFAFALGNIFNLKMDEISVIARLGSGSATRSVFGGIVEWNRISDENEESKSTQLFNEFHWPQLRVIICVVTQREKKTSSKCGMQTSVETSQLFQHRIQNSVHKNIANIKEALKTKNFPLLAETVMRESNQLHAICLDTYPPIIYLNSTSHCIIDFVHAVNEIATQPIVAYTFDAGPNAFLIMEESMTSTIQCLLHKSFDIDDEFGDSFSNSSSIDPSIDVKFMHDNFPKYDQRIERIISTKIGSGPMVVTTSK